MKDFEKTKLLIGHGAFGDVYLVRCKLNDCKYALKVLNKEKVHL
jgi:serine/threonine protein kinase